jgi:hypothetical protein
MTTQNRMENHTDIIMKSCIKYESKRSDLQGSSLPVVCTRQDNSVTGGKHPKSWSEWQNNWRIVKSMICIDG